MMVQSSARLTDYLRKRNVRRMLTVYAICWIIGIGILLHWWAGVASADTRTLHYTVHEGDTLWTIAQRHISTMDTRVAVDELMKVNHLDQAQIYPGEDIVLPEK